jgi:hypothetical protein
VVPTEFSSLNGSSITTNQFSVTENFRAADTQGGRNLPGLFFFYDLSPIRVRADAAQQHSTAEQYPNTASQHSTAGHAYTTPAQHGHPRHSVIRLFPSSSLLACNCL